MDGGCDGLVTVQNIFRQFRSIAVLAALLSDLETIAASVQRRASSVPSLSRRTEHACHHTKLLNTRLTNAHSGDDRHPTPVQSYVPTLEIAINFGIWQVKSAGTTIKDKLEMASLEAGLGVPGEIPGVAFVAFSQLVSAVDSDTRSGFWPCRTQVVKCHYIIAPIPRNMSLGENARSVDECRQMKALLHSTEQRDHNDF